MKQLKALPHICPQTGLTARQVEVVGLLGAGYTNGDIARSLGISLDGAKWHVSEVLGKLGMESRGDVMCWVRTSAAA
jgi:DNA-binding NarL/FixJ family response regulator